MKNTDFINLIIRLIASAIADVNNTADARGGGISLYGPGSKIVNLIIHDAGGGIGFWDTAVDGEACGNIIFNNGFTGSDGSLHGHGMYVQNGGSGGTHHL